MPPDESAPIPPSPQPVAPLALHYAGPATPIRIRSVANLHQIAICQRDVTYPFLGCAIVTLLTIALARMEVEMPSSIVPITLYAITIFTAVVTFRLAVPLHGIGFTIFIGIFLLVPGLGFIIFSGVFLPVPTGGIFLLLLMNSTASRTLRRHGIRVGLMGADRAKIAEMATDLRQEKA